MTRLGIEPESTVSVADALYTLRLIGLVADLKRTSLKVGAESFKTPLQQLQVILLSSITNRCVPLFLLINVTEP